MTHLQPGDDLGKANDDEVRAVIREYGLQSPWYGSSEDFTLRDEVHERDPRSRVLHGEVQRSAAVDQQAGNAMTLDWDDSPLTLALQRAYDEAVQRWLDGPEPVLSDRLRDDDRAWEWTGPTSTLAVNDLEAAGVSLRWARKHLKSITGHATRVADDAIEHHDISEVHAAELLGVQRKTLRRWLGKPAL